MFIGRDRAGLQAEPLRHRQNGRVGQRFGEQQVAGSQQRHQAAEQAVLGAVRHDDLVGLRVDGAQSQPLDPGLRLARGIVGRLVVEQRAKVGTAPDLAQRLAQVGFRRSREWQVSRQVHGAGRRAAQIGGGPAANVCVDRANEGTAADLPAEEGASHALRIGPARRVRRELEAIGEFTVRR